MQAYGIKYHIRGNENRVMDISIDAKDTKSAKKKIGKKHGYKDGRMVIFDDVKIIGYF
jgi:hypothetical protein